MENIHQLAAGGILQPEEPEERKRDAIAARDRGFTTTDYSTTRRYLRRVSPGGDLSAPTAENIESILCFYESNVHLTRGRDERNLREWTAELRAMVRKHVAK